MQEEKSILEQLKECAMLEHRFWVAVEKTGKICYDWKHDLLFAERDGEQTSIASETLTNKFSGPLEKNTPLGVLTAICLLEEVNLYVINSRKYITKDYLEDLLICAGFSEFVHFS